MHGGGVVPARADMDPTNIHGGLADPAVDHGGLR